MIALVKIAILLIADAGLFVILSLRSSRSLTAENLFLRRQLALCNERGIRLTRVDTATRVSMALLSRLFDWRDALIAAATSLGANESGSPGAPRVLALQVTAGPPDCAGASPTHSAHGALGSVSMRPPCDR